MRFTLSILGLASFVQAAANSEEADASVHRQVQCGTQAMATMAMGTIRIRGLQSCFFNNDPVFVDFGPFLNLLQAAGGTNVQAAGDAETEVLVQEEEEACNICGGSGGRTLPEVNQVIRVDDTTFQECVDAAQQGIISETFCDLLVFFDLFTCGDIQTNPALFGPFCSSFQSTLGVACDCNTLPALPPQAPLALPAPEEPAVVPGTDDGPAVSFFDRIASLIGRLPFP